MPTEDRNTIDCTFQHSSLDIQLLNPSIPPSEVNIPALVPSILLPIVPTFHPLVPTGDCLTNVHSFHTNIPPPFLSQHSTPGSHIPSPKSSIPTSCPYNQSNIPSDSAFHPFKASILSLSPPVPTFQPSKPQCFHPCPFNVHIPPSTCNLERAVGPGPVIPLASSVSLEEPWEIRIRGF